MVDWSKCPLCGATDFEVSSVETIIGIADISLFRNGAILDRAEWGGETKMIWDSSETTSYFCTLCGDDLPKDYQEELAKVLR